MEIHGPFWEVRTCKTSLPSGVVGGWALGKNARHRLVQLSKTFYYLVDNLLRLMLSIARLAVKKKQGQALRIKRRTS